jgi:hypothetical protein
MKKLILHTLAFWFFGVLCAVSAAPLPQQSELFAALCAVFVVTPTALACVWFLCLAEDSLHRALN